MLICELTFISEYVLMLKCETHKCMSCPAPLLVVGRSHWETSVTTNPGGWAVGLPPPHLHQSSRIKSPQVVVAAVVGDVRYHNEPGGRC